MTGFVLASTAPFSRGTDDNRSDNVRYRLPLAILSLVAACGKPSVRPSEAARVAPSFALGEFRTIMASVTRSPRTSGFNVPAAAIASWRGSRTSTISSHRMTLRIALSADGGPGLTGFASTAWRRTHGRSASVRMMPRRPQQPKAPRLRTSRHRGTGATAIHSRVCEPWR